MIDLRCLEMNLYLWVVHALRILGKRLELTRVNVGERNKELEARRLGAELLYLYSVTN